MLKSPMSTTAKNHHTEHGPWKICKQQSFHEISTKLRGAAVLNIDQEF